MKILIDKETVERVVEALETLDSGDTYKTHNAATALRKALEQSTEQEPVGFMCQGCFYELDDVDEYCEMEHVYLYTQPQEAAPRKPLTDEQLIEIYLKTNGLEFYKSFARAIEAAHGITGEIQ